MKEVFSWDKFKSYKKHTTHENRIGVICRTESDALKFCELAHKNNARWNSGSSYEKYTGYKIFRDVFNRGGVIYFNSGTIGLYSNYNNKECYTFYELNEIVNEYSVSLI